jgi:dienelactone hydrolase
VGAGAAPVLETELTAASIRHNLKAYPRATHVFFDDQLRACHLAAAAGTPSSPGRCGYPAAAVWHGERDG